MARLPRLVSLGGGKVACEADTGVQPLAVRHGVHHGSQTGSQRKRPRPSLDRELGVLASRLKGKV